MSSGEKHHTVSIHIHIHSITMNIHILLRLLWASLFFLSPSLSLSLSLYEPFNQYSDYAGNNHAWRIFNLNITCCSAPHAQV